MFEAISWSPLAHLEDAELKHKKDIGPNGHPIKQSK